MVYFHEYDERGNHRLGTRKINSEEIRWGKWASYKEPAMLGQYAAVTDYFTGSVGFPNCDMLYRIQKNVWPLTILKKET